MPDDIEGQKKLDRIACPGCGKKKTLFPAPTTAAVTKLTKLQFAALYERVDDGSVTGWAQAKQAMRKVGVAEQDVLEMIASVTKLTWPSQRSGKRVRYDLQDSDRTFNNYQIQLGGTELRVNRSTYKNTSVNAVIVMSDVIEQYNKADDSAQLDFVEKLRTALSLSYESGIQYKFQLV
ncbi:MAG: hypothetical protein R3C59_07220 [Planctomycetaceae bacterium]